MTKRKNEDDQVSEAMEQAALAKRRHEVSLVPYSDGQPFDRAICTYAIKTNLIDHVKSGLEIGRCLMWARGSMEHGEFLGYLEEVGVARTTAWRYMKIAELARKFISLRDFNMGQILALGELPEKELEELDREGHVGDLTVDEVGRMTPTEMRRRIRRYKDERQKSRDNDQHKDAIIASQAEDLKNALEGNIYTASEKKLILEADKAVPKFMRILGELLALDRFKTQQVAYAVEMVYRRLAEMSSIALHNFLDELNNSDDDAVQRVGTAVNDVEEGGAAENAEFWRKVEEDREASTKKADAKARKWKAEQAEKE